jgi:hypothetical protein
MKNGKSDKVFMGVQMPAPGVTRGEDPRMPLHPFASQYEYIGGPIKGEGIFEGTQSSPWIRVSKPSDWYRGPWVPDRTQRLPYRRQPRPLSVIERAPEAAPVSPGTAVSGCGACTGMGAYEGIPTWMILAGVAVGAYLILR